MFLQFWLISASRSYKFGSYKKKKRVQEGKKVGIETLEINPYIEFGHSKIKDLEKNQTQSSKLLLKTLLT